MQTRRGFLGMLAAGLAFRPKLNLDDLAKVAEFKAQPSDENNHTSTAIIHRGFAADDMAAGQFVYLGGDGKWHLVPREATETDVKRPQYGFALQAASARGGCSVITSEPLVTVRYL